MFPLPACVPDACVQVNVSARSLQHQEIRIEWDRSKDSAQVPSIQKQITLKIHSLPFKTRYAQSFYTARILTWNYTCPKPCVIPDQKRDILIERWIGAIPNKKENLLSLRSRCWKLLLVTFALSAHLRTYVFLYSSTFPGFPQSPCIPSRKVVHHRSLIG